MYYEIVFFGLKSSDKPEDTPQQIRVAQEADNEPEAIRKLLDTYRLVWVESITEISRH